MFANSLFILFISASLLLPEIKRTDIKILSFGEPSATLSFSPPNYAVRTCKHQEKLLVSLLGLNEGKHRRGNLSITS